MSWKSKLCAQIQMWPHLLEVTDRLSEELPHYLTHILKLTYYCYSISIMFT